ncbi:hypothetical protein F5X98DRAFT_369287 [Xylaria grammica]|nr:hypothetical protein F5X98DRAFT_369287 [Xylaria grammica]
MPSETGTRLLPSLVDDLAQSTPSHIVYSVAKTKNPADGFDDICAADFARAVDRCSWFIDGTLGVGKDFPTIAYLGPQDLNYAILVLASIKAGYKLLLVSPRNTVEAHLSLLDSMECNAFLTPPNFHLPTIKQVLTLRPIRHVEVAEYRHWLEGEVEADKPYPYTKKFSEAKAEPFVVLHTSGSTGLPKPIVQTHRTISAVSALLSKVDNRTTFPGFLSGKRMYLSFPLFHLAGLHLLLPTCLYASVTGVLAASPPTGEVVDGVHRHGNVQHSFSAPATLQELVREPKHVENLSRIEQVTYGGGPLPKAVGDLVATKTRILNCLGSTECGILPAQLCDDPQDWQYLRLDPILGYEHRRVSDNLYELVIVRDPDRLQYQGIFGTFPDLTEWPTKDLYSKHPDPMKGDHWLYQGRSDDIIVFSTGEKISPNEMEDIINSNPAVDAAFIAGQGRFQSSLLVEALVPPANAQDRQNLLEAIWPSVHVANAKCPSHGRIHRNMILFTTAAKPMLKTGKGTVRKGPTTDLYASELDSLYNEANALVEKPDMRSKGGYDGSVEATIKTIVTSNTEIDAQTISPDSDLFELGLDSLQVNAMLREINEFIAFHGRPQSVYAKTIYKNPTLAALSNTVSAIIHGGEPSNENSEEKLEEMYQLYSANMPISERAASPKQPHTPKVVLITGSTGSLGPYILDSLQRDDRVSCIYCLCRGPESTRRQEGLQASKGLQPLSKKVQCLDAELSKSYFGLPTDKYRELLGAVTEVIHNAWQVDFNLSIQSFTRYIAFVRSLITFSSHSRFGAELFFISSISAVSELRGDVAEKVYTDWTTPGVGGYGQSKFLSERLLDLAVREADVPCTICRVGQVAGPTTVAGEWSKKEWLPCLIASSKYLGKVPDSLGPLESIDWIPVDKLGDIVAELATYLPRSHQPDEGATVYHAVNPHHTTWRELLPTITRHLSQGKAVEVVSLKTWVDALKGSAARAESIAANPAMKLIDFFESLVGGSTTVFKTERTLDASPTLSTIGPIQDSWMDIWMRQWGFSN